ncbi:MAG TPA: glycosyltransferase [Streptosporangiaceae bacterium]
MSVIIPARNEAANLPHVFGTLPGWVDEVVLVDGHSVDDTLAVTAALCPQAKVVSQPGSGKGDALRAGFAAATGDILVTIDADGSTDGAEIIRFVSALVAGADFAKGSRFSSGGGSDDITGVRRYGNRVLTVLVNRMFGAHFTDLCYGYNAFWAHHLEAIQVSGDSGFEVETLMSIRAAKAGLRIYEVPSHECPRIFGASNLRAVRDGWRIFKIIVNEWLRDVRNHDPRRVAAAPAPASDVMGGPAVAGHPVSGSDREDSVHDHEIVAKIAAGDTTGIARAFDRYARALYTYCRSQLAEPADAAGAVLATFAVASAEVRRLGQPDRLRAWLFAVARNECHLRLRGAVPSARLYEAAHAMDDTGAFAVFSGQAEHRTLVRAALAGMDPADREISELNLRHGFYGADLADILGVPRNRAHLVASWARSRFEKSLGVLPMVRSERDHCRELAAILDGDGGQSPVPLGWQVKRHVRRCGVCGERRRSGLNPLVLLDLLPVIPLPTDLRQQTLDLALDESPAAVAYRDQALDRAAPVGADGFPVQPASSAAPGRRLSSMSAVAAAAAATALLCASMYHVYQPPDPTGPASVAARRWPLLVPATSSGTSARGRPPAARAPSSAPGFVPSRPESTGPGVTPSRSGSPSPSCSRARSRPRSRACSTKSPSPSPTTSPSPSPAPSAG